MNCDRFTYFKNVPINERFLKSIVIGQIIKNKTQLV